MKIKLPCLGIAIAVLTALDCRAQTPEPAPPFVAAVPAFAHWTITLKYPAPAVTSGQPNAASVHPADHVVLIDLVRTDKTWQVVETYGSGAKKQYDQEGHYILIPASAGLKFFTLPLSPPSEEPYDYYSKGFLFTEWVHKAAMSAFKNVEAVGGVSCFHYQEENREVWVAVDTLLPVKAVQKGVEADFQFLPAPTSRLALSPEEEAAMKQDTQRMENLEELR